MFSQNIIITFRLAFSELITFHLNPKLNCILQYEHLEFFKSKFEIGKLKYQMDKPRFS